MLEMKYLRSMEGVTRMDRVRNEEVRRRVGEYSGSKTILLYRRVSMAEVSLVRRTPRKDGWMVLGLPWVAQG